jgi:phosphoribosylformylglycinamidine synthase II
VGGILRDVFTMGARPVAVMDSLRFGEPSHPRTPGLLRGVVAGIAGYGNAFGVPTVGGEVQFDAAYNGNILVNAFALGLCRSDRLFLGQAKGVGNPILYVGARTGRDGIHGATMASAEFEEGEEAERPTVQVGDPFMEKLLLEGCLEIFAAGVLEGIQDMGAAGLTSSTVEMASRAGNGVELWLDRLPRRAKHLTPYEILLSESQERMIMVARVGEEQRVLDICAKWDLDAQVVGRVTDTGRFVVRATPGYDPLSGAPWPDDPPVVVDLPVDLLTDAAPVYTRPCVDDPRLTDRYGVDATGLAFDPRSDLLELLSAPNVGSRAWIYRQYDHIVRDGTMVRPGRATPRWCGSTARTSGAAARSSSPCRATATAASASSTLAPAPRWPSPRRAATSPAWAPRPSASPTASTSATRSARRSWRSFATPSTASPTPARPSACRSSPAT